MNAALQQRMEEARRRAASADATSERPGPFQMDWNDVGRSTLTGARSGLESTLGSIGDIGGLQSDITSYGAEKMGLSPEAGDFLAKYTNPMSLFANTEDVAEASDQLLGRDEYTRHEATTPEGQHANIASNFLSGLVGGPENFGKDMALKLGMAAIPAAKAGRKVLGLADDAVEQVVKKVPATARDDLAKAMPPQRDYVPDDPWSVSKKDYSKGGAPMDPEQWHLVGGGVKMKQPFSELTGTVRPPEGGVPPQKALDPADLLGGVGFATLGDKTRNFGTLTDVNGISLKNPQKLEGGYRFGDEFPGSAWASEQIPMGKIFKKAREVSEGGKKRVFGIPVAQGSEGGDAARMMTGPLLDLMKQAELTPEAIKMLDTAMAAKLTGDRGNRWPGTEAVLDNPEWLNTASMNDRAALVKMMNQSAHANERVPVAALRKLTTAPDLLNKPALTTGMNVHEFDLKRGLITDPEKVHSSYPVHGAGSSLGRVGAMPYDWMFQTHAASRPVGEDLSSAQRSVMMQMPTQEFNQQWLDNLMAKIEGYQR